jgi:transglutaminase superfamily protein
MSSAAGPSASPSIARCFVTLLFARLALKTLGFRRTVRFARWRGRRAGRRTPRSTPLAAARSVAIAGAFFPGRAVCLEQSIALFLVLRRLGHEASLRIGVQPYPFLAHAWVEHDGQAVLEDEETVARFVAFPGAFA